MPKRDHPAAAVVRYASRSPLSVALEAGVRDYFETAGRRRDGGPRMWIKSAIILGWLAVSYGLLVFWAPPVWLAIPLALSLALAVAGVGFNIQHDGGHGAYARGAALNRLTSWTLDLVGGSSYYWRYKHTLIHHHFTNIEGVDDDLEAAPFLRLSPGQPRHGYHRFQHLYIWVLYLFFPPKWVLFDDFAMWIRRRIGPRPVPRPRGVDLAVLLVGKLLYLTLALGIPLALHPWWAVVGLYLLYSLALGVTLATVFQLAHCVEEAEIYEVPSDARPLEWGWVEHQLATTVDFAPRNRLLAWYLGGLNFQVEHHLFPRVSHVHYAALAPIVRRVCEEHGVRHRSQSTLWAALRSHVRWLYRMGRPVGAEGPPGPLEPVEPGAVRPS